MNGGYDRATVLTVLTLVEFVVVLFFVARWYGRRWGWRSTAGRLRGLIRTTFADLARPVVQLFRFARQVHLIAALLTDPRLRGAIGAALGERVPGRVVPGSRPAGALREEAGESPYAVVVSPARVAVAVGSVGTGGWSTYQRSDLPENPSPVPSFAHVAIGAEDGRMTMIDLLQAPGVVEIAGSARQAASLSCAIAAQLATGYGSTDDVEVIVTGGVHPRFDGPDLASVLGELADDVPAPGAGERFTVVVCGRPAPGDVARLRTLLPRLPRLRVVTTGPYSGGRWQIRLTVHGRAECPELGLSTYFSPVERAVARALRAGVPAIPAPQTRLQEEDLAEPGPVPREEAAPVPQILAGSAAPGRKDVTSDCVARSLEEPGLDEPEPVVPVADRQSALAASRPDHTSSAR